MSKYVIYTDGGCSPNPGLGGWAALIIDEVGHKTEISGHEAHTTNQRMELTAAIHALNMVPSYPEAKTQVLLFTDSEYLRSGITDWIKKWKSNGWKTSAKKPVANADLWRQLDSTVKLYEIEWHWVKGHAGNEYNERVDILVQKARNTHAIAYDVVNH